MVLEYFSLRKSKDKSKEEGTAVANAGDVKSSVISAEDERFLEKIASESAAPTGTPSKPTIILDNGRKVRSKDAQIALMDGADQIPLPASPPEGQVEEVETPAAGDKKEKRNYWSYMPSIPRTTAEWKDVDWAPYIPSLPARRRLPLEKEKGAADLASAAQAIKAGQNPAPPEVIEPTAEEEADEKEQERKDLSSILDRLHIGSSSTFSLSRESQKLMDEFTQVLKDLVNGVPTAYDDLEKLLTRRDRDIRRMFANMPPWLQTLVKSLPAKMGATLAPELMAGASEKPGADAQMRMKLDPDAKVGEDLPFSTASLKKKAKKRGIPTLKSLVSEQGAVAGMLRSILNFLKLRFPAFVTGTNVLLSVAVFLLLFVFWYCHKRGREVRLESERLAASQASLDEDSEGAEATDIEDSTVLDKESGGAAGTNSREIPSVLDQPEPKEIPLPGEKESAKKGTV